MTFAGLKTDADVQNVIAHLLTFSPDYAPAAPATAPAPAVAPPPAGAPAQPAAPAAQ